MPTIDKNTLREMMKRFFQDQLDQYLDMIDSQRMPPDFRLTATDEMYGHESALKIPPAYSDNPAGLPVARFKRNAGISTEDWEDSLPEAAIELRKGRYDLLKEVLAAMGLHESHDSNYGSPGAYKPLNHRLSPLQSR